MQPYRLKFISQISPFGCFPTAIINAYIHFDLIPPDPDHLIRISGCERYRGTPDKVKLLRSLRGVKFRRAGVEEVLKYAGIITLSGERFSDHAAFFFRSGKRTYAVNADLDACELVEEIKPGKFIAELGKSIDHKNTWVILN